MRKMQRDLNTCEFCAIICGGVAVYGERNRTICEEVTETDW